VSDEPEAFLESAVWPPLADIENHDLLVNELHGKERGHRVAVLGIELDELWSFVQRRKDKQWLWLALNPVNKQIVAFHVGSRSGEDAALFREKIPAIFRQQAGFFSDYWPAYRHAFGEEFHVGVGKESGLTAGIERFNCTLRQRASRLVRKALSFSKSLANHIGAIKYFICHYNTKIKALQI
jgi:insertion element IS1 protein InsB